MIMKKTAILAMFAALFAYGCNPKADDSQQNMNNQNMNNQTAPTQSCPQKCPPKPKDKGCCEAEKTASEGQTASN
jgi:hypothetical protein